MLPLKTRLGSRCRWSRSEIGSLRRAESSGWRWPGATGSSWCGSGSGKRWIRRRRAAAAARRTGGTATPSDWRRSAVRPPTPRSRTASFSSATEIGCLVSSPSVGRRCPRCLPAVLPSTLPLASVAAGFLPPFPAFYRVSPSIREPFGSRRPFSGFSASCPAFMLSQTAHSELRLYIVSHSATRWWKVVAVSQAFIRTFTSHFTQTCVPTLPVKDGVRIATWCRDDTSHPLHKPFFKSLATETDGHSTDNGQAILNVFIHRCRVESRLWIAQGVRGCWTRDYLHGLPTAAGYTESSFQLDVSRDNPTESKS